MQASGENAVYLNPEFDRMLDTLADYAPVGPI